MNIYTGRRISKDGRIDGGSEMKSENLPEQIFRYGVRLDKVREWEEDKHPNPNFWKNKEPKTAIYFDDNNYSVIIIDIEKFNNIMQSFIQKQFITKNN